MHINAIPGVSRISGSTVSPMQVELGDSRTCGMGRMTGSAGFARKKKYSVPLLRL